MGGFRSAEGREGTHDGVCRFHPRREGGCGGTAARSRAVRVQRLKGDHYLMLWYSLKGDQILIHLPIQPRAWSGTKRD